MLSRFPFSLLFALVLMYACTAPADTSQEPVDPLPSWNEGEVKTSIMNFVEQATDPESGAFIEVKDRIATFDNDGNLWSEKPMYFQLFFSMDRVKELAPQHPEWANEQPYQAVLEDDKDALVAEGINGLLKLVMASHAGITTEEFEAIVQEWLATHKHPRFDRQYNELIYQPMLELLDYLRANEFKTFIVSGGGIEFIRAWGEEAYGIPRDQVVGSSLKSEWAMEDGRPVIRKLPEVNFVDDHEGKPIGINQHIGRIPVFASGNSDGDLEMMQYTDSGDGPRFMLYLHHTDSLREWAYDRNSPVGRLDKGLDEAREKGWTVIDMARDWKVVYPFELE